MGIENPSYQEDEGEDLELEVSDKSSHINTFKLYAFIINVLSLY
jgi:hypothetical protein